MAVNCLAMFLVTQNGRDSITSIVAVGVSVDCVAVGVNVPVDVGDDVIVALGVSVNGSGVTFSAKAFTSDAETKVKGSSVKISGAAGPKSQSVQVARLEPLTGESAFVQVEVADSQGNPVANELVRVEFADGTVKEAKLDGSGKAKVSGPKPGSAKVSLPNVDTAVWELG